VTAAEWLAAHTEDVRVEDQHREFGDVTELTEVAEQRAADVAAVEQEPHPDAAETDVADIREVVADEPAPEQRDEVRVPTAEETADTIARAQRALRELEQRQAVEQRHVNEQAHAAELTRGNTEDVAEQQAADEAAEVFG
jgi:hypothetical protein